MKGKDKDKGGIHAGFLILSIRSRRGIELLYFGAISFYCSAFMEPRRARISLFFSFQCIALFASSHPSNAQVQIPVWIIQAQEITSPDPAVLLLEDPDGKLNFSDLSSLDLKRHFHIPTHEIQAFGFTSSTVWLLTSIRNPNRTESASRLEIGYPLIELIRVYVQDSDGNVWSQEDGISRIRTSSPRTRNPAFHVNVRPNDSVTVFIRIRSAGTLFIPIRFWSEWEFQENQNDESFIFGMYYGVLLLLLVYNLILFFSFRDVVYLCYTILVFCYGLSQFTFDGLLHLYLPGTHTYIIHHIFPFAFAINIVVVQILTQQLLTTKTFVPFFHRMMNIVKGIGMALILSVPFLPLEISYPLLPVLTIIAILVLLVPAILRWRQGYQPAKPFTIAIIALSVAVIVRMFRNLGILADISLTIHPVHFGTMLDAVLLSFALRDRVNLRRIENEAQKWELRDRLARDLHDDLATTLGSIPLFATSLRTTMKKPSRKAILFLDRISSLAQDSVDAIGDIVWSVSPERDTLNHLLIRMRDLASQLCTANGIQYKLNLRPGEAEIWLYPEIRRNIYLIFKEALHNAVRHSEARQLTIEASLKGSLFELCVSDNGRGFRADQKSERGHGLRSMEKRARAINARFLLESSPGSGTRLRISRKMT